MTTHPWCPAGAIIEIPGRGELFYRHHRHPDPSRPTVLLLHGWTASADLQWAPMYSRLAENWSYVAPDHRGHGRGIRTTERFELEAVADDAASLVRRLGVGPVIVAGYSMGGPISMLLTHRHRELVSGLVVMATALEWKSTRRDRLGFRTLPLVERGLRSRRFESGLRRFVARCVAANPELAPWADYLVAEMRRGDPRAIRQAGQALSHYDGRRFVSQLAVASATVITTRDRLIRPVKQRALAAALGAEVFEVRADHDATWSASRTVAEALERALTSLSA